MPQVHVRIPPMRTTWNSLSWRQVGEVVGQYQDGLCVVREPRVLSHTSTQGLQEPRGAPIESDDRPPTMALAYSKLH